MELSLPRRIATKSILLLHDLLCCYSIYDYRIQLIIIVQRMGSYCNPCNCTNSWEKQLEELYKNDQKTGSIVKLTPLQKEQCWATIKNKQFSITEPNLISPISEKPSIGFLYLPGKYFYEGYLKDKKMNGEGRIVLNNHQIIYEGSFTNNKVDGKGEICIGNQGLSIKGRWKNGHPSVIILQFRGEQHEIKFKQNCLNEGTISFADGRKYTGKFELNIQSGINGEGKLMYKNGDYVQGNFTNGFLQGKGTFQNKKKGYIYQGEFKDGLFDGEGTFFFSKNQFLKINWAKNKPHGTGTFTKNNQTYVVSYHNGVRSFLTNGPE